MKNFLYMFLVSCLLSSFMVSCKSALNMNGAGAAEHVDDIGQGIANIGEVSLNDDEEPAEQDETAIIKFLKENGFTVNEHNKLDKPREALNACLRSIPNEDAAIWVIENHEINYNSIYYYNSPIGNVMLECNFLKALEAYFQRVQSMINENPAIDCKVHLKKIVTNPSDNEVTNLLVKAAYKLNIEAAKLLFRYGADVKELARQGYNAFHAIAENKEYNTQKELEFCAELMNSFRYENDEKLIWLAERGKRSPIFERNIIRKVSGHYSDFSGAINNEGAYGTPVRISLQKGKKELPCFLLNVALYHSKDNPLDLDKLINDVSRPEYFQQNILNLLEEYKTKFQIDKWEMISISAIMKHFFIGDEAAMARLCLIGS